MKKKIMIVLLACVMAITALFVRNELAQSKKLSIAMFTGSYWDVPEQDSFVIIQDAIDQFCQNDACEIEYVTGITQERYEEWLSEKYLKNEMPDLFFVPNDLFSTYVSNGILMELDALIANDDTFQLGVYYDVSLSAVETNYHIYALPYASSPTLTLVNNGLLEELTLDAPDQDWTWNDVIRYYQQIKDEEDIILQHGYTWEIAAYATDSFFFNEERSTSYFSSQEMIDLVSYMRKIYEVEDSTLSDNAFENDNVVFQPVSYSAYKTYTSYPYRLQYVGSNWTSVALPAKQADTKSVPVNTLSIGIFEGTNNKELAWEFLKYLTTDYDVQKQLMMETASVSVLKSVLQDEELQTMFNQAEQDINLNDIDAMMENGVTSLRTKKYTQVVDLADTTMNALISNEQDIENNLIVLNRSITEFLSQYYK